MLNRQPHAKPHPGLKQSRVASKKEGEGHVKLSLPHFYSQRGKYHDVKTLTKCSDISTISKKKIHTEYVKIEWQGGNMWNKIMINNPMSTGVLHLFFFKKKVPTKTRKSRFKWRNNRATSRRSSHSATSEIRIKANLSTTRAGPINLSFSLQTKNSIATSQLSVL